MVSASKIAKKISLVLGVALLALGTVQASAETGTYIGGNYVHSEFDDSFDTELGLLNLRVGRHMTSWLALEWRGGVGVVDDSFTFGTEETEVDASYLVGVYATFGVPNNSGFFPYAIVGVTRADFDVRSSGVSADQTETDLSYGLGVDWSFQDTTSVYLEYMLYLDKNDVEYTGINLGFKYNFPW